MSKQKEYTTKELATLDGVSISEIKRRLKKKYYPNAKRRDWVIPRVDIIALKKGYPNEFDL
jgi:hypothetical protein